ncbi:MAG: hypothetical protein FJ315_04680 [SAR202 cluster bacterium]|nr:hypothetical protein [SAR202 cluster bacterium]
MQSERSPAHEGGERQALPRALIELVDRYLDNIRRLEITSVEEVAAVPMGELYLIETVVPGITTEVRTRLHAVQGLVAKRVSGVEVAFREMERPADSWPGHTRHILYRRDS